MQRLLAIGRWIKAHAMTVGLIVALGVVAILVVLLRRKTPSTPTTVPGLADPQGLEKVQQVLVERIQDAQATAQVEQQLAKAQSDQSRAKLEAIKAVPDPADRRKQLANFLDANL